MFSLDNEITYILFFVRVSFVKSEMLKTPEKRLGNVVFQFGQCLFLFSFGNTNNGENQFVWSISYRNL